MLMGKALPADFGAPRTVFILQNGDINAQGWLIRTLEALRPLTLCKRDCKIITSAVCAGLRKYLVVCIHPSQMCVAQRMMTDNIFEIEIPAIGLRTCYSEDPGIPLRAFTFAFPSVDHKWIFMVRERAGVPLPLQNFLCGVYTLIPTLLSSTPALSVVRLR